MGRQRAQRLYPSDLTDKEWRLVKPLIPVKTGRGKGRGRPRILSMRAVLNALFYLNRTGCQWDYFPRTYPKRSSVRYYYDAWRKDGTWEQINSALCEQVWVKADKEPEPSAAIIDCMYYPLPGARWCVFRCSSPPLQTLAASAQFLPASVPSTLAIVPASAPTPRTATAAASPTRPDYSNTL